MTHWSDRFFARGMSMIALLATSACASFDGMPKPVIPAAVIVAEAQRYSEAQSYDLFAALPDEAQRRLFRDKVIAIHLAAIDA